MLWNTASKSYAVIYLCCFSVAKSCPNLCDPMDSSMPVPTSLTTSWSSLKFMCIESLMPSNYLILCHPLLILPSIFPSNRVFSSESAFRIRWPKYWSFSFNISPSNEYLGLITLRTKCLDLLYLQGSINQALIFFISCFFFFVQLRATRRQSL